MKTYKAYSEFMSKVDKICYRLVGILMAAMVAVLVYQVLLRYCFGKSNLWAEEVARYLCIYVTFIGSFVAIRKNSHLKVDFFVDLLENNLKRLLMLITNITVTVFLVYMTMRGVEMVQGSFRNVTSGLNIPMAYPYMAIPLGGVLMILGMVEQIMKLIFEKESETSKS